MGQEWKAQEQVGFRKNLNRWEEGRVWTGRMKEGFEQVNRIKEGLVKTQRKNSDLRLIVVHVVSHEAGAVLLKQYFGIRILERHSAPNINRGHYPHTSK